MEALRSAYKSKLLGKYAIGEAKQKYLMTDPKMDYFALKN